MDIINKIIIKYLVSTKTPGKVFYASLLTTIHREECDKIPTVGVTISDGQLCMLYNKNFINLMLKKEGSNAVKGILEHELLHIVYDHLSKARELNRVPKIYNYACDISINQLLDSKIRPKNLWLKDEKGEIKKGEILLPALFNLPEHKDSEYYYNQLIKKSKKMQGKGSGQSKDDDKQTLDNHDLWRNIRDSRQVIKEVTKKAVSDAYKCTKKLRGHIPSELEEAIKTLLAPPTINWRQVLKRYIGASIKTGFKSSWKRPNRRFPMSEDFKGKIAKRTIRMLIAIDTSGSVNTKDFKDFIIEMKGILNIYKCKIDIIQCDAALHGVTHMNPYSETKISFKGRGGTSFAPVFKYLRKHLEYDLLIYFTDLYCDFQGCTTNRSVIWVCTSDGDINNKPPVGNLVQIKHDK